MSVDFTKIRDDLLGLETAVQAGRVSDILHSTSAVIGDAADVYDLFTPSSAPLTVGADAIRAECSSCCDRLDAFCKARAGTVGSGIADMLSRVLADLPQIVALVRDIING